MAGVSVIIPVYNRGKYIKEAIQSVLEQDFSGTLEVLISDDGSTDDSIKIAETFGDAVKILLKPNDCKSQGASGARNRGILAATQPYICFLDSDDAYLPGHLTSMVALIGSRPDVGFAISRLYELTETDGRRNFSSWTAPVVSKKDLRYLVLLRSRIVHTNVIILRRDVFKQVGLFNEAYSNGEDGDMWMRVNENYAGVFSDHFGAFYRKYHGFGQLTTNTQETICDCSQQIFSAALKRYLENGKRDVYRFFLIEKTICGIDSVHKHRFLYYLSLVRLMSRHPFLFICFLKDYLAHR